MVSSATTPVFRLEIRVSSTAFGEEPGFEDYDTKQEIACILRSAALAVGEDLRTSGVLIDLHGTAVGRYEMKEE